MTGSEFATGQTSPDGPGTLPDLPGPAALIAPDANARPLRVAHVTFGLDVGGLEKLLLPFAQVGSTMGHRPLIVSLGNGGPVGDELVAAGHEVIELNSPSGLRPSLWGRLYRLFRSRGIDVVHTHDARPLIYAAPAARLAGVGVRVHTQHGRVSGGSGAGDTLARLASRCVTDWVGVSDDIVGLSRGWGMRPRRFHIVRNGVPDVGRTPRPVAGRVVTVARLSREKGVDVLARAAGIVRSVAPEMTFRVAGDGPDRPEVEAAAGDRGDGFQLLGTVSDVPALLRSAEMFVLPSRSEGVSLTILESMFAGVPVVATAVGGTPEVVDDGRTGVLVPPDDPAAMADAIVALHRDVRRRERLATAGREFAVANFSADAMLRRYDAIYRSVDDPVAVASVGAAVA